MSPSRFWAVQSSPIAIKGKTSTYDDEDRGKRSKADAKFTVGKAMHDVDQQVSNNNGGPVLGRSVQAV